MTFLLLFLQFDWNKLRPENLFGQQILERTPAGLSLIYMGGIALLLLLLLLSFIRNLRPKFAFEEGLPKEVRRKLSLTQTNRSLRIWQFIFVFLALSVFGFHFYWTVIAEKDNERFQELSSRDLRVRRTASTSLRGWMLDRSGNLAESLAYYKKGKDGGIERTFALDKEMSHILGTELGSPGLERTLYKQSVEPMPESWEVLTRIKKPEDEQKDVRITIDRDLQAFLAKQLEGKTGSVVALDPQTGDVLAMYSNPTFSLSEIDTAEEMHKLERDKKNRPLLSRSTREYYVPGSTFKTFTMISAFRAGKQNEMFVDTPQGYVPCKACRPITDDNRSCENCGELQMPLAFEFSSNQFFSWMAVELGRDRLRETAQVVGIEAVDDRSDALNRPYQKDIWNASNDKIKGAMALQQSTIVTSKTGPNFTLYDLAIQGMGQGLAGQMTPFQMAMITAAVGNVNGNLMKPKIEFDLQPKIHANVLSPQHAQDVRNIMLRVTTGSRGTAKNVAAIVGPNVLVGGKTGTAQKMVPEFDANGNLKTYTVKRKNKKTGEITEIVKTSMRKRIDGWFIALAPVNNPQVPPKIAIAVVVEDIGSRYGGSTAAPIAANVIVKARELGLLGDALKPKTQSAPTKPRGGR